MKRLLEYNDSSDDVKRLRSLLSSEDSTTEINSSEIINNYTVDEKDNGNDFSLIEKQIIGKALAMIRRSNSHDLDYETYVCEGVVMSLTEQYFIYDTYYNITVGVWRNEATTDVDITYHTAGSSSNKLSLVWETNSHSNQLTIYRTVSNYIVFTKEIVDNVFPINIKSDNWCYFQDIRNHLHDILILFD